MTPKEFADIYGVKKLGSVLLQRLMKGTCGTDVPTKVGMIALGEFDWDEIREWAVAKEAERERLEHLKATDYDAYLKEFRVH